MKQITQNIKSKLHEVSENCNNNKTFQSKSKRVKKSSITIFLGGSNEHFVAHNLDIRNHKKEGKLCEVSSKFVIRREMISLWMIYEAHY